MISYVIRGQDYLELSIWRQQFIDDVQPSKFESSRLIVNAIIVEETIRGSRITSSYDFDIRYLHDELKTHEKMSKKSSCPS